MNEAVEKSRCSRPPQNILEIIYGHCPFRDFNSGCLYQVVFDKDFKLTFSNYAIEKDDRSIRNDSGELQSLELF